MLVMLIGFIFLETLQVDSPWDEVNVFIQSPLLPTQQELLSIYDKWLDKYHINYTDNAGENRDGWRFLKIIIGLYLIITKIVMYL